MKRRRFLGGVGWTISFLAAGCLRSRGNDTAGDGDSEAMNTDPAAVFDEASGSFPRGSEGLRDFGPDVWEMSEQSPTAFGFVVETASDLEWLLDDASFEDLPVDESFVEETSFPEEQLFQAEVVRPSGGHESRISDLQVRDRAGVASIEVERTGGGVDLPVLGRHLLRVDIERSGFESLVVRRGGEQTAARAVSEFRE